jgi:adenylate cyclase class 2
MEKIEYEGRILEIDKKNIIEKLEALGAKKEGEYNYRRYTYEFDPKIYEKWIRLRTDGTKTTLTIKEIKDYTVSGTREKEIIVSDFDMTNEILNELGYKPKNYQENNRIRYILDNVEIDIDTWPLIPTYMEIEGKNENDIYEALQLLEIEKSKLVTLDVESIFLEVYGIDIGKMKTLKF